MANKLLIKRGNNAQLSGVTPSNGEPLWVSDTKKLHVGDGSTAGGIEINVGDFMTDAAGTLSTSQDLNSVIKAGCYKIGSTATNMPAGCAYGQLLVIHTASSNTIVQIASSYDSSELAYRSGTPSEVGGGGSWGFWVEIAHSGFKNHFRKVNRQTADKGDLGVGTHTLDLDNYATFQLDGAGAITINNPTLTQPDAQAQVRSGYIFIQSNVTSIAWGTSWRFNNNLKPPGGQQGAVFFTTHNSTFIACNWWEAP